MMKRLLLYLLMSGHIFYLHAQQPAFNLSTDKLYYRSDEVVNYFIQDLSAGCAGEEAIYIQLTGLNGEPKLERIIKRNKKEFKGSLPLAGIDTGYYIIRAYTASEANTGTPRETAIGIDIPVSAQPGTRQIMFSLYPEGGTALLNFTNRVAVCLQTANGLPLTEKIEVKNKAGQVIAVANTDMNGWAYIDLPTKAHDELSFIANNQGLLKVLDTDREPMIQNIGFALRATPADDKIIVEVIKAGEETQTNTKLEVLYGDSVLYESAIHFTGDNSVVETSFSTIGIENRLLQLLVKREDGDIEASRLVTMPRVRADNDAVMLRAEIDCRTTGPVNSPLYSFLAGKVSDYLIPMNLRPLDDGGRSPGFTLYFQNSNYANKTIDYAILKGGGNILQGGEITADSLGRYAINNCDFSGEATIQFYENNKPIMPFAKPIFPEPVATDAAAGRKKLADLIDINRASKNDSLWNGTFAKGSAQTDAPVKELKEVAVSAVKRNRKDELEEKYVTNGMFKDMNSFSINAEDDQNAVNYSLEDYLIFYVPGLTISTGGMRELIYRRGYLEYYVDEFLVTGGLPAVHMRDVAYIKFFRNPISSGMSAQRGGAMLRGSSYTAGLQGSVAIYIRKNIKAKPGPVSGITVRGYEE